jgi:NADPH-dependent 2,4-dienoyl-CoA reductase/sulfur reductase-like enzyme
VDRSHHPVLRREAPRRMREANTFGVLVRYGRTISRFGEDAVERYDMVVIGGGAAGINAAKTAASLKARVALVDRGPLGGTCINRG